MLFAFETTPRTTQRKAAALKIIVVIRADTFSKIEYSPNLTIEYSRIFHSINSRLQILICVYQIFNSSLNQLIT